MTEDRGKQMSSMAIFRGTLIVLLTLVGAYVLLISLRIIIVLLIAIIVASAVRPPVQRLTRLHIPESVAIILIYSGLAVIIVALFAIVLPPIVNQVAEYIENDWRLASRIIQAQRQVESIISDVTKEEVSIVAPEEIRAAVSEFIGEVREVAPGMLQNIGNTVGNAVLIFVMGAYWLTSHEKATEFISQLSPPKHKDNVRAIINEIEVSMGGYVRGIAIISSIVGILNYAVLELVGVPDAPTLAFIIALTTTIPMIGGFLGGVIIVFLTLISAPEYVPIVFITFFVITQLENYVLTPRIMGNSVNIDPLLVIIYTATGFIMLGIVGALIAVPLMGTLHILITHLIINPYTERLKTFQTEAGLPLAKVATESEDQKIEEARKLQHPQEA